MKKYLLLFIFLFLLSGCQNYRELNKLGIITAVAVDYDENNKQFEVATQIVNTISEKDVTSNDEPSFVTFYTNSSSLQEAMKKLVLESSKELYTSQIQLLILSKNVINNHINEVLDFFIRDPNIRDNFKVIIAKDDEALNSITIQTILDNISSLNISQSLENSVKKEGLATITSLNDLTNMYLSPYLEITLPSIFVEGDTDTGLDKENKTSSVYRATPKIGTTAIFKEDKFVDFLNSTDDKYFSIINKNTTTTVIKMNYKDGYIVFEPNHLKVIKRADPVNNIVNINIFGLTRVHEISSNIDIQNIEETKEIEVFFNKEIKKEIENSFYNIRDKYNTDIYGFRDLYYKTNPKYYKTIDNNWYKDIFPNLKVNVKTNIRLYEKGSIKEAISYEKRHE